MHAGYSNSSDKCVTLYGVYFGKNLRTLISNLLLNKYSNRAIADPNLYKERRVAA